MSTLKVNKLRDTTGSTDAIVLDPSGGAVLAGVTTVSAVKVGSGVTISSDGDVFTTGITTSSTVIASSTVIVGSGVTISESGIEASGIGITCANINGAQIGGRRNLVINGAMQVAQRATSSTANGYGDLDRWKHEFSTVDESPTFAQVSLTTSDTPYTLGLTKAAKITNGNQTSGLQAASLVNFNQNFEAQDVRNSGWNYKSDTSYLTLSFWVRASVAQNYHGFVKTQDGSNYSWSYETGALSANTWTKIVKKIPGNSNLTINNDTGGGFQIFPIFFAGTNYTSDSISNDTWKAWSSSERSKDQTATWFATNDATLEITGVQLEVGSQATPFEHRSFAEELVLCQRYCVVYQGNASPLGSGGAVTMSGADGFLAYGHAVNGANPILTQIFPVLMRQTPSQSRSSTGHFQFWRGWTTTLAATNFAVESAGSSPMHYRFNITTSGGMSNGDPGIFNFANTSGYLIYDAEL